MRMNGMGRRNTNIVKVPTHAYVVYTVINSASIQGYIHTNIHFIY